MGNTYGEEVLFLTDHGANEIVDDVLSQVGLSHEEQLRRAALLGFVAAGGGESIVIDDSAKVVIKLVYTEDDDDDLNDSLVEPVKLSPLDVKQLSRTVEPMTDEVYAEFRADLAILATQQALREGE